MYLSKETAVNVLRTEYRTWIPLLTEEERKAIRKYSFNSFESGPSSFFKRLNAMLRGEYNKEDSILLTQYADTISEAIGKHTLQNDVICYRGVDVDMTAGLENGTIFRINQFLSTTIVLSQAFKKKYTYIIYVKQGSRGAYIEELSYYKKQREFLLDKNCKYKLLSRQGNIIEVEVINDEKVN